MEITAGSLLMLFIAETSYAQTEEVDFVFISADFKWPLARPKMQLLHWILTSLEHGSRVSELSPVRWTHSKWAVSSVLDPQ